MIQAGAQVDRVKRPLLHGSFALVESHRKARIPA